MIIAQFNCPEKIYIWRPKCLYQDRAWISNVICRGIFYVQSFE